MSKATQKDELLAELAYLEQAEYIDKQACVQLVKIVKQHFAEQSGEVDLKELMSPKVVASSDEEWKRLGFGRQAEQSGGVVTEANELVGGWLYRIWEHADTRLSFEEFIDVTKTILQQPQRQVSRESISDFVNKEWADAGYDHYTTPETYEVKAMITDFIQQELGIPVGGE